MVLSVYQPRVLPAASASERYLSQTARLRLAAGSTRGWEHSRLGALAAGSLMYDQSPLDRRRPLGYPSPST